VLEHLLNERKNQTTLNWHIAPRPSFTPSTPPSRSNRRQTTQIHPQSLLTPKTPSPLQTPQWKLSSRTILLSLSEAQVGTYRNVAGASITRQSLTPQTLPHQTQDTKPPTTASTSCTSTTQAPSSTTNGPTNCLVHHLNPNRSILTPWSPSSSYETANSVTSPEQPKPTLLPPVSTSRFPTKVERNDSPWPPSVAQ